MENIIHFISIPVCSFLYSFFTSILIVAGIEKFGEDPGSPAIMLIGFLVICIFLSIVTAGIMSNGAEKGKVFPVKFSFPLFVVMYVSAHLLALYVTASAFWGNVSALLLFISHIPFYHVFSQCLLNGYDFIKTRIDA